MQKPTVTRRQFFGSSATLLGGAAVAAANPGWVLADAPATNLVTRSTWSMGTVVNLTVPREAGEVSTFVKGFGALARVETGLSAHTQLSELGQLNTQTDQWLTASDDMLAVARAAVAFGDLTEGALDVTVLPFLRQLGLMPAIGGAKTASGGADYQRLQVRRGHVRLADGYAVDFGGIAKGYAADEAVHALRDQGIGAALLEAGGDIVALGRPNARRRWRVGIRDPKNPERICASVAVENEAIATSGVYEQPGKSGGPRHIIDPASGKPVHHVTSATVVAPSAMEADALATALTVMTRKAGQHLIDGRPRVEAFCIYEDGDTFVSAGLQRRLKPV